MRQIQKEFEYADLEQIDVHSKGQFSRLGDGSQEKGIKKTAKQIGKKHNYQGDDLVAICIAGKCRELGIKDRFQVARHLKRGASAYYKSTERSHFVNRAWLKTPKGTDGFKNHTRKLRKKADNPKYKAADETLMSDTVRKYYQLPKEKHAIPELPD